MEKLDEFDSTPSNCMPLITKLLPHSLSNMQLHTYFIECIYTTIYKLFYHICKKITNIMLITDMF
uniref:Uncharacterized protein n=1 Tax=Anguilla anguilla TaxID=7936 RepID=A0A0E9X7Z5_ANGAN